MKFLLRGTDATLDPAYFARKPMKSQGSSDISEIIRQIEEIIEKNEEQDTTIREIIERIEEIIIEGDECEPIPLADLQYMFQYNVLPI